MRRNCLILLLLIILTLSCSDKEENIAAKDEMNSNEGRKTLVSDKGISLRESDGMKKNSDYAGAKEQSDANCYELILRDNENYYYFLNQTKYDDKRYYTGKVFYKSNGYQFRGECKVVNRSGKAFAVYYKDIRNGKISLISIDFNSENSGHGSLYYETLGTVWPIIVYVDKGSF